jgi:hypothetical protein
MNTHKIIINSKINEIDSGARHPAGGDLIYMNGSSDYVEGYIYFDGTTRQVISGEVDSWFSGVWIRS